MEGGGDGWRREGQKEDEQEDGISSNPVVLKVAIISFTSWQLFPLHPPHRSLPTSPDNLGEEMAVGRDWLLDPRYLVRHLPFPHPLRRWPAALLHIPRVGEKVGGKGGVKNVGVHFKATGHFGHLVEVAHAILLCCESKRWVMSMSE